MPSAPIYRTLVRPLRAKVLDPLPAESQGTYCSNSRRGSLERNSVRSAAGISALAPCTITFHDFGSTGPKVIVISAGEQLNDGSLPGIVGLRRNNTVSETCFRTITPR